MTELYTNFFPERLMGARPVNWVHGTNILHTARAGMLRSGTSCVTKYVNYDHLQG